VNDATDPDGHASLHSRDILIDALVETGKGDRSAFREVYRLTAAKLFGICLRICGERQAAEDVLNEVYITVWTRAATFQKGRASPITWLATIARNRAIDWRRAQHPERLASLDRAMDAADPAPLATAVIEARQGTHTLRQCLEALDGDQSAPIREAFFGGRTYSEVAAAAATPLATIKSRVRRGLMKLKECLERD
jgi:RNA polymerase sigma-70 factor (ECF subfamily)